MLTFILTVPKASMGTEELPVLIKFPIVAFLLILKFYPTASLQISKSDPSSKIYEFFGVSEESDAASAARFNEFSRYEFCNSPVSC